MGGVLQVHFLSSLLYCLFTNDFCRCNNQQVECVWATGVWGKTCKVCLKAKQKCDALWGEVAAENSSFSTFSPMGLAMLERLVAGVERWEWGGDGVGENQQETGRDRRGFARGCN